MDTGGFLVYLLLFVGIFYFLLYRPQQKHKKQRLELMDSLRVANKIVTIGGIHGEIKKIKEDTLILKIAKNVEIEIQKTAVGFINEEEEKSNGENDYSGEDTEEK